MLQGRSLPMLRDAPGGTFVLVQVVRGALKGGVDAVVVLLQNRFGAYALRALNGKAAVRAVNAARNDVVAHGSLQGALNATAPFCENVPASAVPLRKPRAGDAKVLSDITDEAMARASATRWLSAPPSAGGFALPPEKLAVTGAFPRPSAFEVQHAAMREESAALASEIEALSPRGSAEPGGAPRVTNTPLSVQEAQRAAAAELAWGRSPLETWAPMQASADSAAVSPPYREFVELPQRGQGSAEGRPRSPTEGSKSSRSSRESTLIAAMAAGRVRELVALRVHSDAAKVLAEHGVDGQALAFLSANELLKAVADAGVEMSAVSMALFRRAVADAAASAAVPAAAAQPIVIDLEPDASQPPAAGGAEAPLCGAPGTRAQPLDEPHAAISGARISGARDVVGGRRTQFEEDDARAVEHFAERPPERRSAEQVEESRQMALARRAASMAARGEAVRALVQQVGGEVVELLAAVQAVELPELMTNLAHMVGVHVATTEAGGNSSVEILTARVCYQVNAIIQRAHMTARRALAPHSAVQSAHSRVVLAVAALSSTGGESYGSGQSTTKTYGDGSASVTDGAVRAAATNLAGEPAARAALDAAHRMSEATADGQYDSERPQLRAAMRALETGQFGADVYTLLHQEKLTENPSGQWTPGARAVYSTVRELRSSLMAARERLFARVTPEGVDTAALVAAVNAGTLSVATLVPKTATLPAHKAAALQRVWPLLMAVAAEVLPSDGGDRGVAHMLLRLALTAFDYGKTNPGGSVAIVETVLAEWAQRWKRVREGVHKHDHARALAAYEWTKDELAAKQGMQAAVSAASGNANAQAHSTSSRRQRSSEAAADKPAEKAAAGAPAKRTEGKEAATKVAVQAPGEKRGPLPPSA